MLNNVPEQSISKKNHPGSLFSFTGTDTTQKQINKLVRWYDQLRTNRRCTVPLLKGLGSKPSWGVFHNKPGTDPTHTHTHPSVHHCLFKKNRSEPISVSPTGRTECVQQRHENSWPDCLEHSVQLSQSKQSETHTLYLHHSFKNRNQV